MRRKLFVDTNVLLDAAMSERPERNYALLLMDEFAFGEVQGYVAATSLKDIYYVLGKYADEPHARRYVRALMELLDVVSVDAPRCLDAVGSDEPDFEDGLIRSCAESVPAHFIISRDEKAFRLSPVKRLSAKEYITRYCAVQKTDL